MVYSISNSQVGDYMCSSLDVQVKGVPIHCEIRMTCVHIELELFY